MQIYKETGKLKTNELRITRGVGALMLAVDKQLSTVTNERISVYVERANGANYDILNNVLLKDFLLLSTIDGHIIENSGEITAICELAQDGNIKLNAGENIIVSLTGLTSTATYTINAIEYPVQGNKVFQFDRKTLLNDEHHRQFEVSKHRFGVIDVTGLTDLELTYSNKMRIRYSVDEIKLLMLDAVGTHAVSIGSDASLHDSNKLMLPLDGVTDLDIHKTTGAMELTLY